MRALLVVLDSAGVGHAPDADKYNDAGANTLGHIFDSQPDLRLPNLEALGLTAILHGKATLRGADAAARQSLALPRASFGRMRERSAGKDTTTGHWEIAGAILEKPFATFERFPDELVRAIEQDADLKFIGNYACSGTTILEKLGDEHLRTRRPILYTSADSVLQIAAHENVIPIARLYEICAIARRHCNRFRIGRVIARPFEGEPGNFRRTRRRHDYSMQPPRTILNALVDASVDVIGIGKISDIFAGSGLTESHPTESNADGMRAIATRWDISRPALLFANLVDFDMLFGHRRDVAGYAQALVEFDQRLGEFLRRVNDDDLVIVTADHGNDPTFPGTDHTREEVPLFVLHQNKQRDLGTRETFADVAATLTQYFQLPPWPCGSSLLS